MVPLASEICSFFRRTPRRRLAALDQGLQVTNAPELFASASSAALWRLRVKVTHPALEEPLEGLGNCSLGLVLRDICDGYHFSLDGFSEHVAVLVAQAAGGASSPKCSP